MKYLNPFTFFKELMSLIRSSIRFFRYIKITKELDSTGKLSKLGLRRTPLGKLYYIKNLQPEVLLAAEEIRDFELLQVRESLAEYNEPIMEMGIIDFVKTGFERIKTPDFYAYLIWIEFDTKDLTIQKLLYVLLYAIVFSFTLITWGIPYLVSLDWPGIFNALNSK